MKKLLLIAALLFASYGAFADDLDDFARELRNGLKEAMSGSDASRTGVRLDRLHRIVFIDFWMPVDLRRTTAEENLAIRRKMIKQLKDSDGAADIKELNVTLVYNYISKNGRIVSVVISSDDL